MHSVITSKIPDDYSLTYTTRLDDMLNLAQAAYGLRDDSYIIQGIDFVENNSPQIWYPGSYKPEVLNVSSHLS